MQTKTEGIAARPWVVKSPSNDSHAFDVYSASGHKLHHGAWAFKETAQLIAAAPELLEALCEVAAVLEDRCGRRAEPDVVHALAKAREALTKAGV